MGLHLWPDQKSHVESKENTGNIGNLHPMKLGKMLAGSFSFISDIRRIGKNIISINFKYRHEANSFVENGGFLPDNLISYIPNFKIYRTGIVKGVDLSLNDNEIRQGIKFLDANIEIRSLSRLKYRDRETMELKDSTSVKIEFASNLLPKYLYIWSVRVRVKPYVNRIRRCYNCCRWGHSSLFCKGKESCPRCGGNHRSDSCDVANFNCINCGGSHHSFDASSPVFYKYKIINTVMAYCNVNHYKACNGGPLLR